MSIDFYLTLDKATQAIEDYPYLRECFSDYLKWLFEECDESRRRYDAIYVKLATDISGLDRLENIFYNFGSILNMNEHDFCQAFRFDLDRNKNDIRKLSDLLAEPWVALALHNLGFKEIKKIQTSTGKFSDFTANWNTTKFAIEVKNARNSDDTEFIKKRIDAQQKDEIIFTSELRARDGKDLSQQEEEILPNRLERRISTQAERDKITSQLKNTTEEENCNATMLVIYLEMMSGLMSESMVAHYLQKTKSKLSISDYFACCITEKLYCSPQLP